MSSLKDAFTISAWASEVTSSVPRRPSWLARRVTTRPPDASAPTPPTTPAPPLVPAPSPAPMSSPPSEPAAFAPVSVELGPVPSPGADFMAAEALAQAAEENAALRAQVAEMASSMARLRRQVLEASEGELVKLALAIAERVIGRELETTPSLVVTWAREAIETLAAKDEVVIAVAKDVSVALPHETWAGVGVSHELHVDLGLAPGVVEVRTPQGILAESAEARLGAVAAALGMGEP